MDTLSFDRASSMEWEQWCGEIENNNKEYEEYDENAPENVEEIQQAGDIVLERIRERGRQIKEKQKLLDLDNKI